ncbi:MAG: autotransporter outer membrane beta-barrel domain-containing protein [Pseudomonadota bacterium]
MRFRTIPFAVASPAAALVAGLLGSTAVVTPAHAMEACADFIASAATEVFPQGGNALQALQLINLGPIRLEEGDSLSIVIAGPPPGNNAVRIEEVTVGNQGLLGGTDANENGFLQVSIVNNGSGVIEGDLFVRILNNVANSSVSITASCDPAEDDDDDDDDDDDGLGQDDGADDDQGAIDPDFAGGAVDAFVQGITPGLNGGPGGGFVRIGDGVFDEIDALNEVIFEERRRIAREQGVEDDTPPPAPGADDEPLPEALEEERRRIAAERGEDPGPAPVEEAGDEGVGQFDVPVGNGLGPEAQARAALNDLRFPGVGQREEEGLTQDELRVLLELRLREARRARERLVRRLTPGTDENAQILELGRGPFASSDAALEDTRNALAAREREIALIERDIERNERGEPIADPDAGITRGELREQVQEEERRFGPLDIRPQQNEITDAVPNAEADAATQQALDTLQRERRRIDIEQGNVNGDAGAGIGQQGAGAQGVGQIVGDAGQAFPDSAETASATAALNSLRLTRRNPVDTNLSVAEQRVLLELRRREVQRARDALQNGTVNGLSGEPLQPLFGGNQALTIAAVETQTREQLLATANQQSDLIERDIVRLEQGQPISDPDATITRNELREQVQREEAANGPLQILERVEPVFVDPAPETVDSAPDRRNLPPDDNLNISGDEPKDIRPGVLEPRGGTIGSLSPDQIADEPSGVFAALPGLSASGTAASFAAGFSLAKYRRQTAGKAGPLPGFLSDERLVLELRVNGGFVSENAAADQDGFTISVGAIAAYLVNEDLTLGLNLAYQHAEAEGPAVENEADSFGITGFGQLQLPHRLRLDVVAAYTRTDIDTLITQNGVTGEGDTNADAFQIQGRLSRSFDLAGWQVTPGLGVSFSRIERDGFTLSDGTDVDATTTDRLTISAGPSVTRTFSILDGQGSLTPRFGVDLTMNLGNEREFVREDGGISDLGTIGVGASAGLGIASGPFEAGIDIGYGRFGDLQNVQIGGTVSYKF